MDVSPQIVHSLEEAVRLSPLYRKTKPEEYKNQLLRDWAMYSSMNLNNFASYIRKDLSFPLKIFGLDSIPISEFGLKCEVESVVLPIRVASLSDEFNLRLLQVVVLNRNLTLINLAMIVDRDIELIFRCLGLGGLTYSQVVEIIK